MCRLSERFPLLSCLLLVMGMAMAVCAAEKQVDGLSPDDYEKPLVAFVTSVEANQGNYDVLINKLKPYLAHSDMIGKDSFPGRSWPNKKFYGCELAAYKTITPLIHYVYILALTDKEPVMWEFKIFRTKKENWAIYAFRYGPDLGILGGETKVLWKEKEKAKAEKAAAEKARAEPEKAAEPAAGKTETK